MSKIEIKGIQNINGKEVKVIGGGFGENQKVMLLSDIAVQHDVELRTLNVLVNNNIKRFNNNDLKDLLNPSEGFRDFAKENGFISNNRQRNCYILSDRGYAKLSNIMKKDSRISNSILKDYFNSNIVPEPTDTKEYYFYEELSEYLEVFNIEGVKQYSILDYRIDFYIPSLNVAIEYDENSHRHYTYEQQELRQSRIEKELGCKFIRVTDKYSIIKAVALVSKELFGLQTT